MSSLGFIHDLRVADLPADVACQAQRCLLDLVGVAAAGRETELSRIVHDFAVRQMGASEGGSRLIFDGRRASAQALPSPAPRRSIPSTPIALLQDLKEWLGLSVILISHDISTIAASAEDTIVMLRGAVVEAGLTIEILNRPQHAYSRLLIGSVPQLRTGWLEEAVAKRASIALQPDAAAAAYTKRPMRSEADPQTM